LKEYYLSSKKEFYNNFNKGAKDRLGTLPRRRKRQSTIPLSVT
jgi:hypothetical protein